MKAAQYFDPPGIQPVGSCPCRRAGRRFHRVVSSLTNRPAYRPAGFPYPSRRASSRPGCRRPCYSSRTDWWTLCRWRWSAAASRCRRRIRRWSWCECLAPGTGCRTRWIRYRSGDAVPAQSTTSQRSSGQWTVWPPAVGRRLRSRRCRQ